MDHVKERGGPPSILQHAPITLADCQNLESSTSRNMKANSEFAMTFRSEKSHEFEIRKAQQRGIRKI